MSIHFLLENKSKIVTTDDTWDCYVWAANNRKLRGITKRLKKRFYACVRKPRVVVKKPFKSSPKILKGIKGGKLVHGQVELFVEYAKQGKLEEFNKENKADPRLIKIVNELIDKKYQLLYSEYKVGDLDLRLGTGVDILCLDEAGQVVLIEIKTGYENGYIGPSSQRMAKPFEALDRSPWAQHQLQLLTTKGLFEKMTGLEIGGAFVWVVNSKNRPSVYPLHPELWSRSEEIIHLLSLTPDTSKKRKMVTDSKKKGFTKQGKPRLRV